jgi:hypothetical protein
MKFINRSLLVYEVGMVVIFSVASLAIAWPDYGKGFRLATWLFLMFQPILLSAHIFDVWKRRKRD